MSQKSGTYQIIFGITLSIIPFLILSIFAQPIAEDFGFATQAQKNNFWELLVNSHKTMNGRYMANIFMYASPLTFNFHIGYKLAPAVLILFFGLGTFSFIQSLFANYQFKTQLAIALGMVGIFLNGMPIISEGLYWYTGSSIYFVGIIVALFTLAQLNKSLKCKEPRLVNYGLTAILIFMSCGFNETQTIITFFSILVLTVVHYYKQSSHKNTLLLLLIITTASCLFMILAPGNSARSDMYTLDTKDFVHASIYSLAQMVRFGMDWFLSVPFLAISIVYILNWDNISAKVPIIKNGFYLNKWFALLMLFGTIILSVFPAYWFTGILGQHRTLNVGYIAFLVLWFITLSVWLKEHPLFVQKFASIERFQKVVVVLFVLGLLFTDNGYYAIKDLISGDAKQFNNELNLRHELLSKTSNTKGVQLQLQPISAKPKCLFVSDITSDPEYWMNLGYNNYFNLDSVAIYIQPSKPTH